MLKHTKEFLGAFWRIFKILYVSFGIFIAITLVVITFSSIFFEILPFGVLLLVETLISFAYLAALVANNISIGAVFIVPVLMGIDYYNHWKNRPTSSPKSLII